MPVEQYHTKLGFSLGIPLDIIYKVYYCYGNDVWTTREPTDEEIDNDKFFRCHASDLACNMLQYVPGVDEYCDYGDITVQIIMEDADGFTRRQIINLLEAIAQTIISGKDIKALGEPYQYEYKDDYGHKRYAWTKPPLKCPTRRKHKTPQFSENLNTGWH